MYVYLYSRDDRLYTVGFYDPQGKWHPDSDHSEKEMAAQRVAWLNGSSDKFDGTQTLRVGAHA